MLTVMDKSTHEEHLSQLLQTHNKQSRIAIIILSGYNGIFNATNSNKKIYFKKTIGEEDGFVRITIPPGAYEIESLNDEIERIIIVEEHYAEANYPFKIKQKFSTLGSIFEISPQGPVISFIFDDNKKDLSGFHAITLYEEYSLSTNRVDVLSFDNSFLECDIAHGMFFKGRKSNIIHNWTMTVDRAYEYARKNSGVISWYMMQSKHIISSICFKLKNENNQLVSFNSPSITFRLSIKEIRKFYIINA